MKKAKLSPAQKRVVKAMREGKKLIRDSETWDCFLDNQKFSHAIWAALYNKNIIEPSGDYTLTDAGKDIKL